MNKLIIPFLFIACLFVVACGDDESVDSISNVMLSVESHQAKLVGPFGEYECLLVRENNETEWKKHDGIIDFEYKKGYKYQLKVEKTILANPPMDGPKIKYRLIEVL